MKLEPEAVEVMRQLPESKCTYCVQLSIAISLKRIADSLESCAEDGSFNVWHSNSASD